MNESTDRPVKGTLLVRVDPTGLPRRWQQNSDGHKRPGKIIEVKKDTVKLRIIGLSGADDMIIEKRYLAPWTSRMTPDDLQLCRECLLPGVTMQRALHRLSPTPAPQSQNQQHHPKPPSSK